MVRTLADLYADMPARPDGRARVAIFVDGDHVVVGTMQDDVVPVWTGETSVLSAATLGELVELADNRELWEHARADRRVS